MIVHWWFSHTVENTPRKSGLGWVRGMGWAGACTNPGGFNFPFSWTFDSLCRLLLRIKDLIKPA